MYRIIKLFHKNAANFNIFCECSKQTDLNRIINFHNFASHLNRNPMHLFRFIITTTFSLTLSVFTSNANNLTNSDSCRAELHPFEGLFVAPARGKVISPFGTRGGRTHTGTDIKLKKGDSISAACHGVVTMAQTYSGYGKLIILKHENDVETYYSHLSKILVNKGDTIVCNQIIGLAGSTGRATTDHLHFEIRKSKKAINAEKYFDFKNGLTLKTPFPTLQKSTTQIAELIIPSGDKPLEIRMMGEESKQSIPQQEALSDCIKVEKGDTLYSLAKRHQTTVQQLQALNQLKGNTIFPGQVLKLK